jgi:polysaccharide export outer membrane protein
MRLILVFLLCFYAGFSGAEEALRIEPTSNASSTSNFSNYKLGPGDVITISVYGEDDLVVSKVRLTDTGTITFPSVGEVSILGKRVSEVEELIASKLRGRVLVNPKVSASVDEYRPFYITGGVKRPGGYPYQSQLTVGKAVSLSGGYSERADKTKIYIQLDNNDKVVVNENSFITPGDNLVIEEYDPIFVDGMVVRPGSYPYQDGLTIRQAVSLASGFHERASMSKIFIIKAGDKKHTPIHANLETPVQPGDTIIVEESFF